ncbi:hypothetical protein [Microbacterium ulmi]|uniref:Uncharacterized protein n=1 Tax=Microbacterium ulmi TaxID=179095 RepID=A0A7Y2PY89_9MICO|nr:hypothetical protein [Microbacterium ulmi]NII68400.1 hypothetical protein [Microbacterium ulmi]NNH03071.1 hypothetical protein [Microbacterium ulmi]
MTHGHDPDRWELVFASAERKKWRGMTRRVALGMVVVSALACLAAVGFLVIERNQLAAAQAEHSVMTALGEKHDEAVAAEEARKKKARAEANAARLAAAQDARARQEANTKAQAAGFTPSPTADSEVFYKHLDGDCSTMLGCAWLGLAVARDCPSGVYVAANLESADGVVVSYANAITGALDPEHASAVELKFPQGGSDGYTYRVTDAHCM